MQTVWTFLVYFWLLAGGGLRNSQTPPPLRTGLRQRECRCVYVAGRCAGNGRAGSEWLPSRWSQHHRLLSARQLVASAAGSPTRVVPSRRAVLARSWARRQNYRKTTDCSFWRNWHSSFNLRSGTISLVNEIGWNIISLFINVQISQPITDSHRDDAYVINNFSCYILILSK